jgi:hypothetical protein
MKKAIILAVVSGVVAMTGCVFVRPSADTILTIQDAGTPELPQFDLGFRECSWAVDTNLVVTGYGWHPREHETYAFFISEGLPDFQPRWILVSQSPAGIFPVDLWFTRSPPHQVAHFVGSVSNVQWSTGSPLRLSLRGVHLHPSGGGQRVTVSGRIIAKPDTPENVQRLTDGMTESPKNWQNQPSEGTR